MEEFMTNTMTSNTQNNHIDIADLDKKICDNAINKTKLHDITLLAGELKRLLIRHDGALADVGVRREIRQLEDWLESQRKGPVPASIISGTGMSWLVTLRDKLKLSADEAIRLEGEGGNPSTKEQAEKMDDLLKAIRRMDKIIDDSKCKPH
jgi:hypothetical protein